MQILGYSASAHCRPYPQEYKARHHPSQNYSAAQGLPRSYVDAFLGFLLVDGILKKLSLDAHDDAREHLDEAAVGVPGE